MKLAGKEIREIKISPSGIKQITRSGQYQYTGETVKDDITIKVDGMDVESARDGLLCSVWGYGAPSVFEEDGKEIELVRYIINRDAAILFWSDNTKTVVKRMEGDTFNKRVAFLHAYFQKMSGLSKTKANKFLDNLEVEDD